MKAPQRYRHDDRFSQTRRSRLRRADRPLAWRQRAPAPSRNPVRFESRPRAARLRRWRRAHAEFDCGSPGRPRQEGANAPPRWRATTTRGNSRNGTSSRSPTFSASCSSRSECCTSVSKPIIGKIGAGISGEFVENFAIAALQQHVRDRRRRSVAGPKSPRRCA